MNIPVFYSEKMIANLNPLAVGFDEDGAKVPLVSASKPTKVVESWKKQFPIDIIEPTPVTVEDYYRAHDKKFVDDLLSCKTNNGFGNKYPEVAASLPYTSGAMLSAAKHALKTGKVAVAPTSGFHHAEYMKAEGCCSLNGLMVTALALKELGLVKTVGILDLDMHYGNGTDNIIDVKGCDEWIFHFTAGRTYKIPTQAGHFFSKLPRVLAGMAMCDIVLYQAGADPHVNDPYGGFLTTEELHRRDAMVFDALDGIPIAWDLAGGYQVEEDGSIPKVLEIHDNTMKECVRVFGKA